MNSEKLILIVDDTPENLTILGEYLSEFKVKVALSGAKALSIATDDPKPDLILLDIMMPEMDGYEVCRRLKEDNSTKEIPVIFISAMNEVMDKVKGFELGAVDYITKPFQLEEVKSRINTHLTLAALQRRLKNINQELEQKVEERTVELLVAKDKAEESSRVKTNFLALMSHELRTPMAGILGFSEFLMNELDNEVFIDFAKSINESGQRLRDTLDSILNLSKLESEKMKAVYSKFDIIEESEKLLKGLELNAQSKNLQLTFKPELTNPVIKLDKIMYQIIFNNLVNNAIKYTKAGRVTAEIFSESVAEMPYTCLRVSDTGIGIPSDKHEYIFEEFRQVDEGMKRNFEGVGLGLSLVKKYVALLEGKIELISEPGKGSVFTIKFPAKLSNLNRNDIESRIKKSKSKSGQQKDRNADQTPKVLLVEDEATNRKIAKLYLADFCELDMADNGVKAIDLATRNFYSAILMDINLGQGLSGIEVTREIKKLDRYKDVPIIAFTAFALDGDEETFLEEGCTHYLPKPCSRDELIDLLNEVI